MFKDLIYFFNLNLKEYENIGIDFPIGAFLCLLLLFLSISLFVTYFYKKALSDISTALLRYESFDETSARTLSELRINSFLSRYILSQNRRIYSMITVVGKSKIDYEAFLELSPKEQKSFKRFDFQNDKLYLEGDGIETAKIMCEKNNASILTPILFTIAALVLLVLLSRFLPDLLRLIK